MCHCRRSAAAGRSGRGYHPAAGLRYDASPETGGPAEPDQPIVLHAEPAAHAPQLAERFHAAARARFRPIALAPADVSTPDSPTPPERPT
jgi:hypothetical protein